MIHCWKIKLVDLKLLARRIRSLCPQWWKGNDSFSSLRTYLMMITHHWTKLYLKSNRKIYIKLRRRLSQLLIMNFKTLLMNPFKTKLKINSHELLNSNLRINWSSSKYSLINRFKCLLPKVWSVSLVKKDRGLRVYLLLKLKTL